MRLSELSKEDKINIEIAWGELKFDFHSRVVKVEESGIYATPYIYKGKELAIGTNDKVYCNIYANNPANGQRVEWCSVTLSTEELDGELCYYIQSKGYSDLAVHSDRRSNERIVIQKRAEVVDEMGVKYEGIIIHDISDVGISFYAPSSFEPLSSRIEISFSDSVDDKIFDLVVKCTIARTERRVGNILYGCRLAGDNRDYCLYGFLLRSRKRGSAAYLYTESGNHQ